MEIHDRKKFIEDIVLKSLKFLKKIIELEKIEINKRIVQKTLDAITLFIFVFSLPQLIVLT